MKKIKKYPSRLLSGTLLVATFLLTTNSALAFGQVTLTVKNPDPFKGNHSWFIYEKEAGQVIEDVATLKNFSSKPADVNIYAVDATSSYGGSFILKFKEEDQKSIGYWTDVDVKSITINPSEVIDVPFKIVLPENVTPGEYIGGLIVETGDPLSIDKEYDERCADENLCGTSIAVRTRVGTRIYLTVPGKTYEDFALTDFSVSKSITGTTKFQFRIENNGNVAYQPQSVIDVYDNMGNLYEHIENPLGISSPGTVINPVVKMKNRPLIGNFTAKASVSFDRQFGESEFHSAPPTAHKEVSFWVMPWEIIFIVLLFILAVGAIITQRKMVWKSYLTHAEEYSVQNGEDVVKIAKERHINWKKLAKFNKLKPPYIIREGDTLKVPKK